MTKEVFSLNLKKIEHEGMVVSCDFDETIHGTINDISYLGFFKVLCSKIPCIKFIYLIYIILSKNIQEQI